MSIFDTFDTFETFEITQAVPPTPEEQAYYDSTFPDPCPYCGKRYTYGEEEHLGCCNACWNDEITACGNQCL